MVARAQSSDFAIFMRKIGYSVGLEQTLSRLDDFARLYAGQDILTLGDIKRLLHAPKPQGWNLEPQNEHILDFFRAIEVISVRGGDVGVLELGEALGIACRLQDEVAFAASLRFFLAHALVLADGDIFLNALASQFDQIEFERSMTRLIEYKWTVLESTFLTTQQRAAIYRSVTIEMQDNNPGSRGKAGSQVGPLASGRAARVGPLGGEGGRPEIRISPNYLAKVLGRRRSWAVSLGLCDGEGALSTIGHRLISNLASAGYAGPSCMATWPLAHELATPLFTTVRLPAAVPKATSWDFMVLIGRGLGLLADEWREAGEGERQKLIEVLRCFHQLNTSKSIIRNEVPVRVAYRCLLGMAIGGDAVPDYPALLQHEQAVPTPRFIARTSRLAEFALSEGRS